MSDNAALYEDDELDFDTSDEGRAKSSHRKKLLFVILPVLLLIGTGAGLYFSGILGGDTQKKPAKAEKPAAPQSAQTVFFDLPPMVVNLDSPPGRPLYLRIQPSIQVADEQSRTALDKLSPRIIDLFEVDLRELRIEDLREGGGLNPLRKVLLSKLKAVVYPIKVIDVLFRNVLIQ